MIVSQLSQELKQKRYKEIFKRVTLCVFLLSSVIFVLAFFGDAIFPFDNVQHSLKVTFYGIFVILPFIVTGIPIKLIDTAWVGTVIAIDVKETTGTYTIGGKPWPYKKNDLILTIEKTNGKIIQYNALSFGVKERAWQDPYVVGKMENHTDVFSIGDKVCKYYYYKYLYVIPTVKHTRKHCINCGHINDEQRSDCLSCGFPLL